ncbi:MAG: TRM11 family SAM-dependent methyltransferase [Desulfurococcaceae archaeon]
MKQKTYFLLRGDNEHLARGELRALLELHSVEPRLECYTMLCISSASSEVAVEVVSRAGYIKEAGVVLGVFDAYSPSDAREAGALLDHKAHVSVLKSTVSAEAVREFVERAGLVHRYGGLPENRLVFTDGLAIAAVKLAEQDTRGMALRASQRPFKRSIALTPEVARALVNLARARRGSLLLDPFAGTGTVLLEAWSMGIRGLAVDVDWELVKGMRENFAFFKANVIPVIGDSRQLSYVEVDHVATDLPYGRGASTHGVEIRGLYKEFFEKLSEYLSKKGYASFMAPLWLEEYVNEQLDLHGFRLVGRYYDYVHSGLTRVISVVTRA